MDPEETFITLEEHARRINALDHRIENVDDNNTALWDYVHGSKDGQFPKDHQLPEGCLELRLQRFEQRISYLEKENNSLKKRLVWALTTADNSQQP